MANKRTEGLLAQLPFEVAEKLRQAIADPEQASLNLANMGLRAAEVKHIVALLPATHITKLNLRYNQINRKGAAYLAENTTLQSLNIASNRIGAQGAIALAAHEQLTDLDVSYNSIGDAGACALANNHHLLKLGFVSHELRQMKC